ncbi:hypothetical protein QBC46DRAFT_339649 [Diplogelasinospora grovesii]|uniref:Uncharacterized protein n=1 Tax=Diplogelasinospora grovesii TaxID=303347 RepID=A0AAN6NB07_9PEZI|nr:hypothetical protein QBC46DRAFT_339649 [Diplogelasinospora grovesii]
MIDDDFYGKLETNGGKGCASSFFLEGRSDKGSLWDDAEEKGVLGASTARRGRKLLGRLAAEGDHGGGGPTPIHIGQWLVSAGPVYTSLVGIQNLAILPTNPALYWKGDPKHFPNVILLDYIGVVLKDQFAWDQLNAEMYTLAIGLNLYLLGENCAINTRRSLVYPAPAATVKTNGLMISAATATKEEKKKKAKWNGVIFANGTKVDSPPKDLHIGRVDVLRKGTRFSNGAFVIRVNGGLPTVLFSS